MWNATYVIALAMIAGSVTIAILMGRARRWTRPPDIGAVSDAWIAQHRADDPNH